MPFGGLGAAVDVSPGDRYLAMRTQFSPEVEIRDATTGQVVRIVDLPVGAMSYPPLL